MSACVGFRSVSCFVALRLLLLGLLLPLADGRCLSGVHALRQDLGAAAYTRGGGQETEAVQACRLLA